MVESLQSGSISSTTERFEEDVEVAPSPSPLDWDGPDDPENPFNWSQAKRWYGTIVPGLLCLLVTLAGSVYVPGVYEISYKFNVSLTVALLGLSLYVCGLGLGPMLSAPLSEVFGRRIVYLVNLPIFLLFILGAAEAKNIQTLLICRAFAGIFGGPALAVSGGSFVDLWELKTSGLAVSVQAIATFMGPALGPIVGGFLAEKKGWRWTMYLVLIFGAAVIAPIYFMQETYKPVILKRRALARGQPLPPKPDPKTALKLIFTITLARPTVMLIKEPIVQAVSLYSSFAFAVLFGFFEAFPFTFSREYGFGLGKTGGCFAGIGLGLILGCVIYLIQDKIFYAPAYKRGNGVVQPEIRMIPAMIGSFLMPIGLFWFAWTAKKDIHWISPVLAGIPFSAGLVLIFLSAIMYILEVYPPLVAASAFASLGLLRYLLAMAFPLFTVQMYERLGVDWATSTFGFVSIVLMPIPWVFKRWGPRIRAASRFNAIKDSNLQLKF
ncbi:MFS general substrate transporter [Terfezia boudieri ATCC MYA-4762]|uniref:MFS general substrate transporter n=1 Tax=Terfezia boudieri ATCC MYA-4762 TaxID=1051890 RepID=A0A3N4LG44_9PEZI|nr:MFS general substrate transporter [Terfezia boudieri ATCC MYA-4762]